jgi:hypothetical protein
MKELIVAYNLALSAKLARVITAAPIETSPPLVPLSPAVGGIFDTLVERGKQGERL